MKKIILGILTIHLLLLLGCSSISGQKKTDQLDYVTISNFKIGSTSEEEIYRVLGQPSSVVDKNDVSILHYNDFESGFQRLSMTIQASDRKLQSYIWLPKENELESSLDKVQKNFPNSKYQKFPEVSQSSHMVSSDIVLYVDESAGVSIRYDQKRNEVEAIGIFDPRNCIPTSVK